VFLSISLICFGGYILVSSVSVYFPYLFSPVHFSYLRGLFIFNIYVSGLFPCVIVLVYFRQIKLNIVFAYQFFKNRSVCRLTPFCTPLAIMFT